jgi:hypothetical protein
MTTHNERQEVINWWKAGRDYQQGIMLFARFSKNKVLTHFFMKKSEKYGRRKLEYQLPKAVGLDWKKMGRGGSLKFKVESLKEGVQSSKFKVESLKEGVQSSKFKVESLKEQPAASGHKPEARSQKPAASSQQPAARSQKPAASGQPPDPPEPDRAKEYPKVIRRLKYEYSDLYTKRSVLHKRMRGVPPENSEQNMNQRALLLQEMETITDRMEFLYSFIETWEKTGNVPIEEEIWPAKKKTELPDDLEELKRIKKNLQSANTKDRNRLLYGKLTKGKKENPMPDGPKRQRLEFRIRKREKDIEEIEQKMVDSEV